MFKAKNRRRKSRDTVPLSSSTHLWTLDSGQYIKSDLIKAIDLFLSFVKYAFFAISLNTILTSHLKIVSERAGL